MSADLHSTPTLHTPFHVCLAQTLPEAAKTTITSLISLLPASYVNDVQSIDSVRPINDVESINDAQATNSAKINSSNLNSNEVKETSVIYIKNIVDGRGLACPMPLLKTKVALREVHNGESLYVVATDPNSQADIMAFCQQAQQTNMANGLLLALNLTTTDLANTALSTKTFDTIFHFIITKTDSN